MLYYIILYIILYVMLYVIFTYIYIYKYHDSNDCNVGKGGYTWAIGIHEYQQ